MQIDIRDSQSAVKIDKKNITKCASFVLRYMKESEESELSLLFVSDDSMRKLNKKHRKKDTRTDVLAFPIKEGRGVPRDCSLLGDIVISVDTAKREAKKRRISMRKELDLYLAHGILHLLGYDDEETGARNKMEEKQEKILKAYETARSGRKF